MDQKLYEQIEPKAEILVKALPYIRDFNQKIVVIEYGCRKYLRPIDEQEIMQDIALLKTVGMIPVVVHDTPMGVDKFRENKRIAKLIELCGEKAIGICGVDTHTLKMTIENGYIPVIVPNDIDNENELIDPKDTALEIAVKMKADKLVFLSSHRGIWKDEERTKVYPRLTVEEVKELLEAGKVTEGVLSRVERGFKAVEQGVNRVHILDGRIRHALLVEFFSVAGVGTIIINDKETLYAHEMELEED
ncbi:MAG: acetylglutamate kinase [Eubacteriales bacterium]|nr:acetylglutamate kinase [Eubacteriales bacterium]